MFEEIKWAFGQSRENKLELVLCIIIVILLYVTRYQHLNYQEIQRNARKSDSIHNVRFLNKTIEHQGEILILKEEYLKDKINERKKLEDLLKDYKL